MVIMEMNVHLGLGLPWEENWPFHNRIAVKMLLNPTVAWLICPTGDTQVLLSFPHDLHYSCKSFSATSQPHCKEGEELISPSASSVLLKKRRLREHLTVPSICRAEHSQWHWFYSLQPSVPRCSPTSDFRELCSLILPNSTYKNAVFAMMWFLD